MTDTKASQKPIPPYLAYKTFRNFIDGLKQAMPARIDRSLMKSMSGANQAQLLAALSYFNLIESDGTPTRKLVEWTDANDDEAKRVLRQSLEESYGFLLNGFDLQRTTPQHLQEQFQNHTSATGDTARKGIAFFLAAAKDANIPISRFLKQRRAGRGNGGRGRRAASAAVPAAPPASPMPSDPATITRTPSQMLLDILDPGSMNDDEQKAVWTLLLYLRKREAGQ